MDPNQTPLPVQQQMPQPMGPAATAPVSMIPHDAIQDAMRSRILKIITILSSVSVLGVFGLFLLSGATDPSISSTRAVDTSTARYDVPVSWLEDTEPSVASYFNADSVELAQANYVVVKPIRASFNDAPISASEVSSILDRYEQVIDDSSTSLQLSERETISLPSFESAYQYEISGLANDGRTQLAGISRVMFDAKNYAHTLEFVAIKAYWDGNRTEIDALINSYEAKQ